MQSLILRAGEVVVSHMDDSAASADDVLVLSEAMSNLAEAYDVVSGFAEVEEVEIDDEADNAHGFFDKIGIQRNDECPDVPYLPTLIVRIKICGKMRVDSVDESL